MMIVCLCSVWNAEQHRPWPGGALRSRHERAKCLQGRCGVGWQPLQECWKRDCAVRLTSMHIVLGFASNSSATTSEHFRNSAIAGAVNHLACNVAFALTKKSAMCLNNVSKQSMQWSSINTPCKPCKASLQNPLNKSSNEFEYWPSKVYQMSDVPSKVSLLRSTSPLRERLPWHNGQMLHSPWQLAVSMSTHALWPLPGVSPRCLQQC